MIPLRQSTATQARLLGPYVDDTDGKTAETGLTIVNTDIRLSANGGNMFAKTSGGGTHDENGWYAVTFDATDTATVGALQVSSKVAGALAVWNDFWVYEEAVFDALYAASAVGPLLANDDGTNLVEAGGDGDHLTAINLPNQIMDIIGDITGNLSGSVGSVTGAVGSVTGDIGGVAPGGFTNDAFADNAIDADVLATNTITAAKIAANAIGASELAADAIGASQLAADAVDEIWDEAMTEIGGIPAVTASFRDALRWLFALSRNKGLQTSTLKTLRNDADAGDIATSVISEDGTTFTRNEWT